MIILPQIYLLSIKLVTHIFCLEYGWLILRVEDIIFESVEKRSFAGVPIPYDAKFLVSWRCVSFALFEKPAE